MILVEAENRLFSLNSAARAGFIWADEPKEWRRVADYVVDQAWGRGREITAEQAAARFPDADLERIPALA